MVRIPNMMFNRHIAMKGMESRPSRRESVGRKLMGPFRKNLDIPNELANKLRRNVASGRASFKVLNKDGVSPNSPFG